MRTRRFLTALWALTKPYWVSEQRAKGLTLLVTVIGLALAAVWMEVQFNRWNNDFYNTLQNKDQQEFFRQLGLFTLLAFIWIIIVVYQRYFQQMLLIEWRTWLTEHFLVDWMRDQAHYRMQLLARAGGGTVAGVDTPAQRIADVRMRENSEGVALYRGEPEELTGLRQRFGAVIANWWALMQKQKHLTWFTSFYGQLAIIFPLVVASPRFFSGQIQLGAIFQTASAFGQVQGALSWFINAYTNFATWKATVDRLVGFSEALSEVHTAAGKPAGARIEDGERLSIEQLSLQLPEGAALLSNTSVALKPHEDVLVT